jgi:hypothetical protein
MTLTTSTICIVNYIIFTPLFLNKVQTIPDGKLKQFTSLHSWVWKTNHQKRDNYDKINAFGADAAGIAMLRFILLLILLQLMFVLLLF